MNGVGGGARASPCRVVAAPPTQWGSLGFFTEPGCVTAAWPREPSGVPEAREALVLASVWVPAGAGREQRWAAGRLSRENGAREKASVGPHPPGWAPRRAAGGRGASPSAAGAAAASASRAAPPPAAERAAPAGASVAGSHPPRRVAVSSSTSGAPAAGGASASPPSRCDGLRSAAGPASGAGQPRPAHAARSGRARPRMSPSRGRRERGAARGRKKLRSGPGSLPAATREGPAAGVGPAPPLWGWRRRPCPGAWFAAAAAGAVAAMPPPSRPRCRSRGSERCKSRGGQGWQGAPAGRASARARRGWRLPG